MDPLELQKVADSGVTDILGTSALSLLAFKNQIKNKKVEEYSKFLSVYMVIFYVEFDENSHRRIFKRGRVSNRGELPP